MTFVGEKKQGRPEEDLRPPLFFVWDTNSLSDGWGKALGVRWAVAKNGRQQVPRCARNDRQKGNGNGNRNRNRNGNRNGNRNYRGPSLRSG
jgi:hypothetical protein